MNVEQDEVERLGECARFASRSVALDEHVVVGFERGLEQLDVHRVVFNDQNAQALSSSTRTDDGRRA